jgi:hypothetical protein
MSDHSALVKSLSKSLQVKSLADLVRVRTSENVYLLIDCSGSMNDHLRNGKTRINGLRDVVKDIQSTRSVRLIAFGGRDRSSFEPIGFVESVPDAGGGTPLTQAIEFARTHKAGRAVVISDGMPDDSRGALDAAREFGGQIDVVFVGNPSEFGEAFLKQLAEATGGTQFTGDLSQPKELSAQIAGLLNGAVEDDDDDDDE